MYMITGSNGQIGKELSKLIPDAIIADRNELDITNETAVQNFVTQNNIDTILKFTIRL